MNKYLIISVIFGALAFYSGFYAGREFNKDQKPNDNNVAPKNAGLGDDPRLHFSLSMNKKLTQEDKVFAPSLLEKNSEADVPPHEKDQMLDSQREAEEEFQNNRQTEIDNYEELLLSMQGNNFAKDEIDQIKNHIKSLEMMTYENTDNNAENEEITVEKMREDLYESLKQNSELSEEEIDQMVQAMFPEIDIETDNSEL